MNYWITVVDDDASNRKSADRILSFNGFQVNCLVSGEELISFLKETKVNPDLILLDIHMTGMVGYEMMKEHNKMKSARNIPVIFLTAYEYAETEAKALSAGAMDFL
nr:response regulator [Ruminococcus sp.]